MRMWKVRVRVPGEGMISGSTGDGIVCNIVWGDREKLRVEKKKKGKNFQKKKGKERRGNISEGEKERKGKETFYREEGRKGNKKGRNKRKEEKSLQGVSQQCGGLWGTLFLLF